jgi:superfamily II DNA helicase RecQ
MMIHWSASVLWQLDSLGEGRRESRLAIRKLSWIIATSAQIWRVRWVIHHGQSYSLVDFYQESGRLSRDGKHGLSLTTVFMKRYTKRHDMIMPDRCPRQLLTQKFDGVSLDKRAAVRFVTTALVRQEALLLHH